MNKRKKNLSELLIYKAFLNVFTLPLLFQYFEMKGTQKFRSIQKEYGQAHVE